MATLAELWRARAPRERRIVAAGLLAVLGAALWAYGWSPLQADRARLARDLPGLRIEAAQVAAGVQEAARLRGATQRDGSGGAEGAIESRAKEAFAAAFGSVAALGDGRYRVILQPVSFDTLARFLAGVAAEHGVVVDRLALGSHAGGTVSVDMLILRASRSP